MYMDHDYTDIDALIAKCLADEATAQERAQLTQWRGASSENQKYYTDAEWLWQQTTEHPHVVQVDTETALAQVKTRIKSAPTKSISMWYRSAGIAAAIAMLMGVWWLIQKPQTTEYQLVASSTLLRDTLTDGSAVVLKPGAGLVVTQQFGQQERRVRLTGDAYFHVSADAEKPFVVEAGEVQVRVVGTQFLVSQDPDATTITVTEGKVEMRFAQSVVMLKAGQSAQWTRGSAEVVRLGQPDLNAAAFANRQFVFNNMALSQVLEQITEVYGIDCLLENQSLAQCPLTARFDQQSLEQITAILQETYGFEVTKTAQTITFKGGACE